MADEPDVLEQLYAVEPEEFVAERKRLERSLRDGGRTEEAAELAKLRKPPLPVFAANRLSRTHPDDVASLIAAGERLVAAHGAADPDQLREAQADLGNQLKALVRRAKGAGGESLSESMQQRLAVLLRAAASDQDNAALLRRGVVQEEAEPVAFDALAGIPLAASKDRPAPKRKADRARERKRRARIAELETQLAEARDTLLRAQRELGKAEAEVERADRRVGRATERLDAARSDL